jgi:hypothetical protein
MSPREPKALTFGDAPAKQGTLAPVPVQAAGRALSRPFVDHPALHTAISGVKSKFPAVYAVEEAQVEFQLRRLLPVKLDVVAVWAEPTLLEQAGTVQAGAQLVHRLALLEVPAFLAAVLQSVRPPTGLLRKLLHRDVLPHTHQPALVSTRAQLEQLVIDSGAAVVQLEQSARKLGVRLATLSAICDIACDGQDRALAEAMAHRRTLLQQALRQAELSMLQLAELRRQAADLSGQIGSILTVTLPALEMARAQSC